MLLALGLNVAVGWAGPARPRLRRLLRLRRLRLRDARLGPLRHPLAGAVGDPDRRRRDRAARLPRRAAVAPPRRRLPRDRDALLPPALPDDPAQRRPAERALPRRPRSTSRAGRTGSRTSTRCASSAGRSSRSTTTSTSRSAPSSSSSSRSTSLNNSRTGRAWRALREDPLAAELMSMPVNRLKLLAFAFGAGVAGLTGTILAASAGRRLPGQLRPDAPDHALRDGHPRRLRQPPRSRGRRDRDQRLARGAARLPRTRAGSSSGCSSLALAARDQAASGGGAVVLAGTIVFGFVVHGLADAFWERRHVGGGRRRHADRPARRLVGAPARRSGRARAPGYLAARRGRARADAPQAAGGARSRSSPCSISPSASGRTCWWRSRRSRATS